MAVAKLTKRTVDEISVGDRPLQTVAMENLHRREEQAGATI